MKQKLVIIGDSTSTDGMATKCIAEIDSLLEQGWRIIRIDPMGGAGGGKEYTRSWRSTVLLEHDD